MYSLQHRQHKLGPQILHLSSDCSPQQRSAFTLRIVPSFVLGMLYLYWRWEFQPSNNHGLPRIPGCQTTLEAVSQARRGRLILVRIPKSVHSTDAEVQAPLSTTLFLLAMTLAGPNYCRSRLRHGLSRYEFYSFPLFSKRNSFNHCSA